MTISPIHNNNQNSADQISPSRNLKVAREFEALFTSIMMKSMRKTISDDGLIPKSIGEKIYTDLLDLEYAKIISNNASFGLAEQIVKQIESTEDKNSILETLQEIGHRPWMTDPRFIPDRYSMPSAKSLSQRIEHWDSYIDEASATFNIDKNLIAAVIAQESGGNPYAVSRAGAKGLMQLMDSTARDLGVKHVFNPHENILAGTRYLNQLLKEFKGDERLALASYNAGPTAVQKYGGIPPYRETQDYIERVLFIRSEFDKQTAMQNLDQTENGE
jgi:Rod binding domain-containing protein